MELIESERPQTTALAEPEPRYHTASLPIEKTEHGHSLLRTLAAILVGLVLIVLIVLLARWIYHKAHHTSVVAPAPSTSRQTPATSSNNNASGAAPSSGNPSAPAANTPSAPSTGSSQITNTGPGDVAAIFVGTALAAAGLHYIISVRKFNKNQI